MSKLAPPSPSLESESKPLVRKRPLKLRIHHWLRWIHIYVSMFSLLVVLFFSLTGITLNHPEWIPTNVESKKQVQGQMPVEWVKAKDVDWLQVVEFLRHKHGLRGMAADMRADMPEGSLAFKAPGYSADCFFQRDTGRYELTIAAEGVVAVMNDLHRGRDSGKAWAWLIDVSGVILTVVSLTGLFLLFYLKKMRTAAIVVAGIGCLILGILIKLAIG